MSGSILQGLEEQLNQETEDVIPYYHKNSIFNGSHQDNFREFQVESFKALQPKKAKIQKFFLKKSGFFLGFETFYFLLVLRRK